MKSREKQFKNIKRAACGSFLKKVSKKYTKEEEILDTKSIFDIDQDSLNSRPSYQPIDSAPTYTPSGPLYRVIQSIQTQWISKYYLKDALREFSHNSLRSSFVNLILYNTDKRFFP